MKKIYGPYLNVNIFDNVENREQKILISTGVSLFSLPTNYIGDILFTIYPVLSLSPQYFPWVGSTYTLRLYCTRGSLPSILLSETSIKIQPSNYTFFALSLRSFNFSSVSGFFATIESDGQGEPPTGVELEVLRYTSSVYISTIEDNENRVDVATILGEPPLSEENLAERILENPNNLLLTDENGYVTPTNLSLQDLYTALAEKIMSSTGVTKGGTWTVKDVLRVLSAWAAGKWRDKDGTAQTYEILDPDDGTSVILEILLSKTSPYKQTIYKG